MQIVTVTLRSDDEDAPPFETQGYAPSPASPLVVTKPMEYNCAAKAWEPIGDGNGWRVSHVPTGFYLGQKTFDDLGEAFAALLRCDPDFPAWPLAKGKEKDPATQACKVKFQLAVPA